jgi:hypothetical protein
MHPLIPRASPTVLHPVGSTGPLLEVVERDPLVLDGPVEDELTDFRLALVGVVVGLDVVGGLVVDPGLDGGLEMSTGPPAAELDLVATTAAVPATSTATTTAAISNTRLRLGRPTAPPRPGTGGVGGPESYCRPTGPYPPGRPGRPVETGPI